MCNCIPLQNWGSSCPDHLQYQPFGLLRSLFPLMKMFYNETLFPHPFFALFLPNNRTENLVFLPQITASVSSFGVLVWSTATAVAAILNVAPFGCLFQYKENVDFHVVVLYGIKKVRGIGVQICLISTSNGLTSDGTGLRVSLLMNGSRCHLANVSF